MRAIVDEPSGCYESRAAHTRARQAHARDVPDPRGDTRTEACDMDVEKRLDRLTGEMAALRATARRLRAAVAVLGATCAVLLLSAATRDVDALRARRVEVLSKSGQPAVVLETNEAGEGIVSTFDGAGHMLVTLRAGEMSGGTVITLNRAGYELVSLGQAKGAGGSAVIFDGRGNRLAALTANAAGDGELRAHNRFGHMLAGVRGTEAAGGQVFLLDARGRDRVLVGGDAGGREPLRVLDAEGRAVLVAETPPGEAGRITSSIAPGAHPTDTPVPPTR
jgi:hypothetical protein